jgi:hypothetical protein
MKRMYFAAGGLTLITMISTYGQAPGAINKVQVTAQALTSHRAGERYVIDLTRKGTVYDVAAAVDLSRVRVRTATEERALSEVVKQIGLPGGRFLIGTAQDLRTVNFGLPSRTVSGIRPQTTAFHCGSNGVCLCNPASPTDCFALGTTECRDSILFCTDKVCYCTRSK